MQDIEKCEGMNLDDVNVAKVVLKDSNGRTRALRFLEPHICIHALNWESIIGGQVNVEAQIRGRAFTEESVGGDAMPSKVFINRKDDKVYTTFIFGDKALVIKKRADEDDNFESAFLWGFFLENSGLSRTQAKKCINNLKEQTIVKEDKGGKKKNKFSK